MQLGAGQAGDALPAFRPAVFFLRPWTGYGLSRGPTGRVSGRYTAEGDGGVDPAGDAVVIDQRFRFNDGQAKHFRWRIVPDSTGGFVATELGSGVQGSGRPVGPDFQWRFDAPVPTPLGALKARFEVTYSLVNAEEAVSHTRLSRWGIPLGSITAFYRQT